MCDSDPAGDVVLVLNMFETGRAHGPVESLGRIRAAGFRKGRWRSALGSAFDPAGTGFELVKVGLHLLQCACALRPLFRGFPPGGGNSSKDDTQVVR